MAESNQSLRKMSRAELLEVLVEQSEAVGKVIQENESLKRELQEKTELLEKLQSELDGKDAKAASVQKQLKLKLQKSNERVKALKASLEAERMIRFQSLADSKTVSEASMYMNQILEDTRKANILYQNLIHRLVREAKKHE